MIKNNKMSFTGKVILITGASSGIGAVTAIHFSKLGAKLALTGRNIENLLKTSSKICDVKPHIISGDISNEDDVKNILSSTIKEFCKLDVLVNNAGIMEEGSIENTNVEQFDRTFKTNVRSMYQLTNLAVPYLIENKGSIVNVSSVNGIRSFPGLVAYNMSKSAIDQFTKSVALDLGRKGVRVNSVNPGTIVTELQKRGGMSEENYVKFLERSKETHILGRAGQPEEVARAIAFLASDDASFITGVNLSVDGGRHLMCPR